MMKYRENMITEDRAREIHADLSNYNSDELLMIMLYAQSVYWKKKKEEVK